MRGEMNLKVNNVVKPLVLILTIFIFAYVVICIDVKSLSEWNAFYKQLESEYSFIKETSIFGNSPSLFISYTIEAGVTDKEIEEVF